MPHHKQVDVVLLNGNRINVDKNLQIIIRILNNLGVKTSNSCQDNNRKVWIEVSDIYGWKKLMTFALHDHINKNKVNRQNGKSDNNNTFYGFVIDHVIYDVFFEEGVECDEDEYYERTGGFPSCYTLEESLNIRFPKKLLKEFENHLIELNYYVNEFNNSIKDDKII